MRVIKTILLFGGILIYVNAQIPNSSFEHWDSISGVEQPDGWNTNNMPHFLAVTKVDKLIDGDYAMKVETNGISFEGKAPGWARCNFLAPSHINQISFNYKIDSIETPAEIEIVILQWHAGQLIQIAQWKSKSITHGIAILKLPMLQISSDTIVLEIKANSKLSSLGYEGYSEIILDNVTFDFSNSVENMHKINDIKFCNLVNDQLLLEFPMACNITICNMSGAHIDNYSYNRACEIKVYPVDHLVPGNYVLKVDFMNGERKSFQFVKM